jgi:hypothetical protein
MKGDSLRLHLDLLYKYKFLKTTSHLFIFTVMLTSALETLVKDTKDKFYIENNNFYILKILTTQILI